MSTGGTLIEVEFQISLLRATQRAYQADLAAAEQFEIDALAAEQKAKDAQAHARALAAEAREAILEYAFELDQLISEWRTLIPKQRGPV